MIHASAAAQTAVQARTARPLSTVNPKHSMFIPIVQMKPRLRNRGRRPPRSRAMNADGSFILEHTEVNATATDPLAASADPPSD